MMQQFFKEEANIYSKMFGRESQKATSGLNVLEDFVCFFIQIFSVKWTVSICKVKIQIWN